MRLSAILLALTLLASVALADWNGTIETIDGQTVVKNPEAPAHGTRVLAMNELWRRGGEDDEVFFGTIAEFMHDADGWLNTIGERGSGPGQFMNAADMFWAPNGEIGVVQAWPGKVVMLTPDGNPGTTFKLPYREGHGFQSVSQGDRQGDHVVLNGSAWVTEGDRQFQHAYLKSYAMDGTENAGYLDLKYEIKPGNSEFIEENWINFRRRWDVAPDGRVAAADGFKDYRIHVWNADGSLDRIIERPRYQAVKRTDEEKERFQLIYDAQTSWKRGSTFKVNDLHNSVQQLFFRQDGSLWVQSSAQRWRSPAGQYTSFDVYDTQGRFQWVMTLDADADPVQDSLFLAGDRAYVVTDALSARMARLSKSGETDLDSEAEPVNIISFEFPLPLEGTP